MLGLYDWLNSRSQHRGSEFLVQSIRNPAAIALPPGFESSVQRLEREQFKEAQKQAVSNVRTKRDVWRFENRIPDSGRLLRSGKACQRADRTLSKRKRWKVPTP